MPAEHQNELFKEFDRRRGSLEKIVEKITEKRKKLYVSLALENIVFGIIVVIMCIVTTFALGVERGKWLARVIVERGSFSPLVTRPLSRDDEKPTLKGDNFLPEDSSSRREKAIPTEPFSAEPAYTKPALVETAKQPLSAKPIPAEPVKLEPVSVEPVSASRYTIQLITYKTESRALKEKNKLAKQKIDVFIIKSDKWYQVCAGTYKNIKEANAALEKFKKAYSGCFVRNTN